jgi:hypothetical protein
MENGRFTRSRCVFSLMGLPRLDAHEHQGDAAEHLDAAPASDDAHEELDTRGLVLVASFVPTLAHFDRLDSRFRLPREVWDDLPGYASFGFAVFKIRGGARTKTIHPMAFAFPVRDPSSLFFPTVHVHDGAVRPEAKFDHVLYFQGDFLDYDHGYARPGDGPGYDTSPRNARDIVDLARAAGVVDGDAPFRRLVKHGTYPNRDTIVTPQSPTT